MSEPFSGVPGPAGEAPAPPPRGALTRLFLRNTAANLALRLVSAAMSLWATAWVIHVYGDERFGILALALQLSGLIGVLAPGVSGAYTREVAALSGQGRTAALRELVRLAGRYLAALGVVLGGLLLAFGLGGGAGLFRVTASAAAEGRWVFALAGVVLTIRWIGNVFGDTLAGLQEYPLLALVRGSAATAGSVVTLLVAFRAAPLWAILAGLAVVRLGETLLLALAARQRLPPPGDDPLPPRQELLTPLLHVGGFLALMQVASLIFYQTDHLVLGVLVSAPAVTAYHVTARLHNLVREFQGTLGSALMPLIAREAAGGNEAAVEQVLYRGTRYHLALVLPVVGTAMLFSGDFLRIWLGPPWERWGPLAAIFVSYYCVALLTNFPVQTAIARARVAAPASIALCCAVVNLGLSMALAPRYGVAGVIAGTLAGYALALPLQWWIVFPKLGIRTGRFLREVVLPVYPAALLAGGGLFLLRRWVPAPVTLIELLAQGAVSGAVFTLALGLTALEKRDRLRIREFLFSAPPSRLS